ncbi:MAG: dihydrolipoyl dehydrogenase [Gammaproteobacteria bacterium]
MIKEIRLPDIGDFDAVEIIEIAVSAGDNIEKEQTLLTLESDKATMDIPSPDGGIIKELKVSVGQKIATGDLIATMETKTVTDTEQAKDKPVKQEVKTGTSAASSDHHAEVVVIGAGPGGYTAAFRAADLGKKTVLIERYPTLGGVCLNVGCIPSKALLHIGKVISEVAELKEAGIDLGANKQPDHKVVRNWTESIINKLTTGLKSMAKQRGVTVIEGNAQFTSSTTLTITQGKTSSNLSFDHAIIAAGSQASRIPGLPDDPRILDSTDALLLENIPKRMLVIGGGIIGLEMATVYAALGSKITIVEMMDSLVAGCDKDIVRPLHKRINKLYEAIYLKTAVKSIKATRTILTVEFEGDKAPATDKFDAILVAVGRQPNGHRIGADAAGIYVDERGFIPVDEQQRTNVNNIFAIGDIVGQPMLAHKATHEGKLAAEVIAGHKAGFDNRVIPSVAYTDPEIAWVGLTENQAREKGIAYEKGVFPWAASGRSLAIGRDEGLTKLLFEPESQRIIGAAIVGPNAGDLIAECALAIEMGADAEDIGLTIHPHPTLSETVAMAAEAYSGTITDLYIPKK